MRRLLPAAQLSMVLLLVTSPIAAEEILYLTNGRQIRVERFWEEGDQIFYEKKGNVFGFPRTMLERVDRAAPAPGEEESQMPETGFRNEIAADTIQAAREHLRKGKLDEAGKLYRRALREAPDSVTARLELAGALRPTRRLWGGSKPARAGQTSRARRSQGARTSRRRLLRKGTDVTRHSRVAARPCRDSEPRPFV